MTLLFSKIAVVFFAFLGFLLVLFIRHKKQHKEPLICPLKADCGAVINSKYSKFFGIDVTTLGLAYYAGLAFAYIVLLLRPMWATQEVVFLLLGITTVAFFFSIYLTSIQAFVLRQWCTWCLTSALMCLVIFVFVLRGASFNVVELLAQYKGLIVLIHAVGAAIGVGAVTITDVFFMRFLKDYRINHDEAATLHVLSNVIWVALGILIVSGIGLFVVNSAVLMITPKFLVKVLIVGVLVVNGVFLNLIIHPRLVDISFGERTVKAPGELHYLRKLAFAFGAVSIVSWYTVFILGSLRTVSLSFAAIFGIYLGLIILAVAGSQYFDHLISKRKL